MDTGEAIGLPPLPTFTSVSFVKCKHCVGLVSEREKINKTHSWPRTRTIAPDHSWSMVLFFPVQVSRLLSHLRETCKIFCKDMLFPAFKETTQRGYDILLERKLFWERWRTDRWQSHPLTMYYCWSARAFINVWIYLMSFFRPDI